MKKILVLLSVMLTNVFEAAVVTPFLHEPAIGRKMAKVKFSALVSEMRNKLNGSVFSKNRGGNYLRNKVTPVNPQTTFQTAVRTALSSLSQAWSSLTESQRLAWNNAVSNFQKTDIFGDLKTPSGINLYVKLGLNANSINVAPISVPPAVTAAPLVNEIDVTADSAPQELTINDGTLVVPSATSIIIEATSPQSPGKSFLKSEFRQIAVLPAATVMPYDAIAEYTAKFGALVAGKKVGVRIKTVSTVSMVASGYQSAQVITA